MTEEDIEPARPEDLEIIWRGQPAITIAILARLHGWTTKHAANIVAGLDVQPFRQRRRPVGLDRRTKLYPRQTLLEAVANRAGVGRPPNQQR